MRRGLSVRGQRADEPARDDARLSRAASDHDRDLGLGRRRRGNRGGDVRGGFHPACRPVFERPLRGFDGPPVRGLRRGSGLDFGRLRRRADGALPPREIADRPELRSGRRDRHGRRGDRHDRRRRRADGGHPDLRRLRRGSKAGHGVARRPRERGSRRQGRQRGADVRRSACSFRPGRDRGVDPSHAQRQSLRRSALDAALTSAAEAMARPADLAAPALAARDCRDRLRGRRLCPARSRVAIFLDRRRRARRGVHAAGPRRGACAIARPQTDALGDAGRALRRCVLRAKYTLPVLAALGLVDAFARLRARAAFLPSPKPSSHR